MLTRPRTSRLIAALQAAITVLVVLVAAHHRAEVRHAEADADAGDHLELGFECASHATAATISSDRGAAVETGECLLCLAAHAPAALVAPAHAAAPVRATASVAIAPIGEPPSRRAAIWRTAPKTSPPA